MAQCPVYASDRWYTLDNADYVPTLIKPIQINDLGLPVYLAILANCKES